MSPMGCFVPVMRHRVMCLDLGHSHSAAYSGGVSARVVAIRHACAPGGHLLLREPRTPHGGHVMPAYLVSRRAIRTASALTLTLTVGLATAITLAPTAGAAPAPATAALDQNGWKLFYTATPGQTNKVSVDARLTSDNTAITYVI